MKRLRGNFSLKSLSQSTGVPYGTLYSWETHNAQPKDWKKAKAVADYFSVSVDELVFGRIPSKNNDFEIKRFEMEYSSFQVEINGPIEIKFKKP